MHWVIQDNMYREEGMVELVATLERFDIAHTVVAVNRERGTINPDIDASGPVMVCGTYGLARIAASRGWSPGSFYNNQHDYRAWVAAYGQSMLNAHALVSRFDQVSPPWTRFFIRPCDDSKAFGGRVVDLAGMQDWQRDIATRPVDGHILQSSTLVACSPVQEVMREARFFVVDGALVAWSTYRVGRTTMADPDVDPGAREFAQAMVAQWTPARAFVLDVGLSRDGWRVVEVNCINCSGFYGANVPRLVEAIESMQPWMQPRPGNQHPPALST